MLGVGGRGASFKGRKEKFGRHGNGKVRAGGEAAAAGVLHKGLGAPEKCRGGGGGRRV